jgi:hypothetical protein
MASPSVASRRLGPQTSTRCTVDKAVRIPGSDGNGTGWRWPTTANSASAEESIGGAVVEAESESEQEEEKVEEASPWAHTRRDKGWPTWGGGLSARAARLPMVWRR